MLVCVAVLPAVAAAADPLAEARRLYNIGQYEAAARYAEEAVKIPATEDSARLVLGRIELERFRRSNDPADLTRARDALKQVDSEALQTNERVELLVGLGACLFLDDKFGPASEIFERALDVSAALGIDAHERLLDWWATALDRLALSRPRDGRDGLYRRIVARMERELADDPTSAPAAYWLAASLRGLGELERAWHAAIAGWVTAVLARDHGAALRADLDRLMLQGIIPERAARLQPREFKQTAAAMQGEWEALKMTWSR